MHQTSLNNMKAMIERHLDRSAGPLMIFDVGACDVNGTYRALFDAPGWFYCGVDIKPGRNVDVVMPSEYELPAISDSVDVIVSGQCLEHVEFPWLTVREMARVLKRGGLLLLIAPSQGHEHRYPLDCYRYMPDGFKALAKWAGLDVLEVYRDATGMWRDCCGVFRKP